MNNQVDEHKLLELYARHAFKDRGDNLERIKIRLNLRSPEGRYVQVLFRRSRICYALSCLMLFLGFGIYGAYYWVIRLAHEQHYIATAFSPDFLHNLQSDQALGMVYALLAGALLSAMLLCGLAYFLKKKAKNLRKVQQNGNTP